MAPLVVGMSLQPAIPQRVALQQSPPPLHRLDSMLGTRGAHRQLVEKANTERSSSRERASDSRERASEFEDQNTMVMWGFQTPAKARDLLHLSRSHGQNRPTNSAEEAFC